MGGPLSSDTLNDLLEIVNEEEEQRNEIQQGTGRDFFEIVSQRDRDFGNFPLKGIEISIPAKAGTKI